MTPIGTSFFSRRGWRLLSLAPALFVMVACSQSAGSAADIADVVADKPGVTRVVVTEADGDDAIPFAKIPMTVKVEMGAGATVEEVLAVFNAYDDAVEDGDVTAIEVELAGPKHATLASGEGVHVTEPAVADLVAAQADATVVKYRREAYPVTPSIDVEIATGGFDAVVAAADRYRDVEDLDSVTVRSAGFVLLRDEVNDDLRVTSARERLVHQVAARFDLLGATVAGRGPLKLWVAAGDANAVRRYIERDFDAESVRRVIVVPETSETENAGERDR